MKNLIKRIKLFYKRKVLKYEEIDGIRYYYISKKHVARVFQDEKSGMFIGSFDHLPGMDCFYSYYESDIRANACNSLRSYLKYSKENEYYEK